MRYILHNTTSYKNNKILILIQVTKFNTEGIAYKLTEIYFLHQY